MTSRDRRYYFNEHEVRKLVLGYNRPVLWHSAHEVALDPKFRFSPLGTVYPSPHTAFLAELGIRKVDLKRQVRAFESTKRIANGSSSRRDLTRAVAPLHRLRYAIICHHPSVGNASLMRVPYYLRIIRTGNLSLQLVQTLIQEVYEKIGRRVDKVLQTWFEVTLKQLDNKVWDDALYALMYLVHDMYWMYREERGRGLNDVLNETREAVKNTAVGCEREHIAKALNKGDMKLDNTYIWLETGVIRARNTPQFNEWDRQVKNRFICRAALSSLLLSFALDDDAVAFATEDMPEMLIMDGVRLSRYGMELRKLGAVATLMSTAVLLEEEHSFDIDEMFEILDSGVKVPELPYHLRLPEPSMPYTNALSFNRGTIRRVFTSMIANVVTGAILRPHSQLEYVSVRLQALKDDIDCVFTYIENVYTPVLAVVASSV